MHTQDRRPHVTCSMSDHATSQPKRAGPQAHPPPSLPTVANASRNCLKTRNPSSRPSPGVDCCLLRSTVMHAPHASCVISAQFSPRDASCVAGKPASRSVFFFSPNASKSTAFDAPGRADFKHVSLFSRTLRVRWEFGLHRFRRLPGNGLRADMGPFSSRTPRGDAPKLTSWKS